MFRIGSSTWLAMCFSFLVIAFVLAVSSRSGTWLVVAAPTGFSLVVGYITFFGGKIGRGYAWAEARGKWERLLRVHLSFVLVMVAATLFWPAIKPRLNPWWITEDSKHDTPVGLVLLLAVPVLITADAMILRKILAKFEHD